MTREAVVRQAVTREAVVRQAVTREARETVDPGAVGIRRDEGPSGPAGP
ncbi:hypothetical protein AB0K47_03470 [Streptomyces tirandamycinicus]